MSRTIEDVKDELFQSIGRQIEWLRSIQNDLIDNTYDQADAQMDLEEIGTQGFDWMSRLEEMADFE